MHKYETVYEALRERMLRGGYQAGDRLPSDEDIAAEFSVSLITVRRAMTQLAQDGFVRRIRGQGSFVVNRSEEAPQEAKRLIALLVTQESYTAASLTPIISGVQAALSQQGYALLIEWNSHNPNIEKASIDRMLSQQVSGFLIYPFDPVQDRAEYARIENTGVPYVLLDRYDYARPSHFVGSSNLEGGVIGTDALLGLGHRSIYCVGNLFFLSSEQERYAGFCQSLRNAGIPLGEDGRLLVSPDYVKLAASIRAGNITALFCCSDNIAYRTVLGLEGQGIRIPQDVSIFGFDDCLYMRKPIVPLSTIHQNYEGLGRTAASLLLDIIQGRKTGAPHLRVQTDVHVVLRESTRPL